MNRKWTEESSRFLRENQDRMDALTIAGRLKVSVAEVERRLAEMRAGAPEPAGARKGPLTVKEATREQNASRRDYERALAHFHKREMEPAARILEALLSGGVEDVALRDRARAYLAACRNGKRPEKEKAAAAHPEELYHAAVFEKNRGNPGRALELLKKADRDGTDGRAAYLSACCHALSGDVESALSDLRRAIRIDRQNRVQARLDADLAALRAHPGFGELLLEG